MTTGLVLTFDLQLSQSVGLIDEDGNPRRGIASTVAGSLTPGSYVNQPLVWDGAAWIPCAGAAAAQQFTGEDNTVNISLPTPVGGFPTVCSWTVETANVLQVERDNVTGLNRVQVVQRQASLWPAMFEAYDVGNPRAGFLGAVPVVQQSITGLTTQDQVDSLVAALVAFGFVTDDR